MNATRPVSQAPSPPASAKTLKTGGQAPDFAAALTSAAAKPARRAGGHKATGGAPVGGHLPADGNVSPPLAPPVSTVDAAASAASAAGFAAGSGAASTRMAADPGLGGAGETAVKIPDQSPGLVVSGATPEPPSAGLDSPGAAPRGAEALGLPIADPRVRGTTGADGPITGNFSVTDVTAATPGTTATIAATGAAMATATTSTAAAARPQSLEAAAAPGTTGVAPSLAAGGARHTMDTAAAAAATAATKAATSGSNSNDDLITPGANAGAAPNNDAAAPATAAVSAAATGFVWSSDPGFAGAADSPALAADAGDSPAKAMPGQKAVPAALAAAGPAAAAARSSALPVSTLADAGAADKHASVEAGSSPLPDIPGDAAAGAVQLSVNTANPADAAPTPTFNVPARLDTPEFGQGIADRVTWMVDTNLNGAKLQVNPPQLGPIEVRIAVQGGHAQVWLTSHSAVTRDALESSSPKLREMLGAQGFAQVSVDISQGSFHERPAYSQPYDWTPSAIRSRSTAAVQSTANSMPRTSSGALDAYA